MAPIPGEPHKSKPQELDLGDGRKVKLKLPGAPPATKAEKPEDERDAPAAAPPPSPKP